MSCTAVAHDLEIVAENSRLKAEICVLCGQRWAWRKDDKGRVNNKEYLKVHERDFAQQHGATKKLYNKIYNKELCIIKL